jgi:hypothetical protein
VCVVCVYVCVCVCVCVCMRACVSVSDAVGVHMLTQHKCIYSSSSSAHQVMDHDLVGTNDFLGHAWVPVAPAVMQRGIIEVKLQERDDQTPWERPRRLSTSSASLSAAESPVDSSPPARPPPPSGGPVVAAAPLPAVETPARRSGSFLSRLSPRSSPLSARRDSKQHADTEQPVPDSPLKRSSPRASPTPMVTDDAVDAPATDADDAVVTSARGSARRSLPSKPLSPRSPSPLTAAPPSAKSSEDGRDHDGDACDGDEVFEVSDTSSDRRRTPSPDAKPQHSPFQTRALAPEAAGVSAADLASAVARADAESARADALVGQTVILDKRVAELEATISSLKVSFHEFSQALPPSADLIVTKLGGCFRFQLVLL